MARPRVKAPKTATAGEVIVVKTLISHPMESGQRKDDAGQIIPRKIIRRFEARYAGTLVFAMDLAPAISANPFIEFNLKPDASGELELTWIEDGGEQYSHSQTITVK